MFDPWKTLGALVQREIDKAYSSPPTAWPSQWLVRREPTIGRKRRARRARGRRMEDKRAFLESLPLLFEPFARRLLRPEPSLVTEQEGMAQAFHATGQGPGVLTVDQWAAAHRTMQGQGAEDGG
jgi:hypothetical protein